MTSHSLSALDLAFFALESRERMSNLGPLTILKPPASAGTPTAFLDYLLRAMKTQHVGSPFDLRYRPAGARGLPRLETVKSLDLDRHCFRHTLSAPGDDAQLFDLVCHLHEKRLDRSRPLWELHAIDGLERDRVALYFKTHHGTIDGRGHVAMFERWFCTDPDDREVRAPWASPPGASPANSRAARSSRELLGEAAESFLSLSAAVARQAMASAGLRDGMPLPFLRTPTVLRSVASARRTLAYCVLPVDRVKGFAKEHDATVNDVLLTVLDVAMRAYLDETHHGAPRDLPLVVDMPVAVSGAQGRNGIAVLQVPLGSPEASPLERLAQIRRHADQVKEHVRRTAPAALLTYTVAVHGIPALLEALRVPRAPVLVNAIVSNASGLPEPRYLAGAALEAALPVSILAHGQALNVTAATYHRTLQLAFLGLKAELPNIQRLAEHTTRAFDEMTRAR